MGIIERITNTVKDFAGWFPLAEAGGESFLSLPGWARGRVSKRKQIEAYINLVYSCVALNARSTALYEPVFYRSKNGDQPIPILTHPLLKVIENPSPEISQYELFEGIETYMGLAGEAFVYVVIGSVTERPKYVGAILRPDKVTIQFDKVTGDLLGYTYDLNNGTKMPLDIKEVWHIKNFNPMDHTRGYGAVEAGKTYIDVENETANFQWGVLKNQASPAGILSLTGKISRDAFKKLKEQWQEQYSGTNNAGKTLFIRQSDANFTKVGLSLTDLQIGDLSKVNDEKVRKLFGVHKEMLGDTGNSGLGRANIEAIEYIYAKYTIDPKFIRLDDKLTSLSHLYYGDNDVKVTHKSKIPKDTVSILAERVAGVDKWITRNEIRSQQGQSSIPGGDQLWTSFSNMPIDTQPESIEETGKAVVNQSHKHIDHADVQKQNRQQFFQVLDHIENKGAKQYSTGLTTLLNEQERQVKATIAHHQIGKEVDFDGTMFKLDFTDSEIEFNLLRFLLNAFARTGEATFESLGKPDEDFILQQAQRDAIFESTDRLMRSFNEETTLGLQQQLSQGLANGETKEQITARVESIYADAKGYRARRIADTEMHKAVNYATSEVYKEEGYTSLVWETNSDACEFCKAMDGTETPMNQPFIKEGASVAGKDGSEYHNNYEDVRFADLHPNCKCRLVPKK